MSDIRYEKIEGAPGLYFSCPSGQGRLSISACAQRHNLACSPTFVRDHRRAECRGCKIGMAHAGKNPDGISRLSKSSMCSRCERMTNRIVRGSICVSCYNREAEARIGLNAKGNPLKKIRRYLDVSMLVVGSKIEIRQYSHVSGIKEAVLSELRNRDERIMFGDCGIFA